MSVTLNGMPTEMLAVYRVGNEMHGLRFVEDGFQQVIVEYDWERNLTTLTMVGTAIKAVKQESRELGIEVDA